MKTRLLTAAGIVVVLLLARVWLATAGSTPAGQPPLLDLTDAAALKAEFNRAAPNLRVIILLSPSCPYCLIGASEIERILASHRARPLKIFVVWQPILPTDWGKPGTGALHRIADARVQQFWDADHRIAAALKASFEDRDPQPNCCFHKDIWWDLMAAFPPGAEWRDLLPEPILLDGTVEEVAPAFEALLAKQQGAV